MVQIVGVMPKQNHCLEVKFNNKHAVILDLSEKLRTVRFSCLNDDALFYKARISGNYISWGSILELSSTEIMHLLQK